MKSYPRAILIIFSLTIQLSAQPTVLWTNSFGGSSDELGFSIVETTEAGYMVVGYTQSFGAGLADLWILKINANGDSLWSKTYGGGLSESGNSIIQTSDGNYVILGNGDFGIGRNSDFWILKIDTNGDTLWSKFYGGVGWDSGYSIKETSDGGFILAGNTQSFGAGDQDAWLLRVSSTGDSLWSRVYGGIADDWGRSITIASDGGFLMAGQSASFTPNRSFWMVRTDANGDSLWTKTLGGIEGDRAFSVDATMDNGFILTGGTDSFAPADDVWLVKLDATGDTSWTKTIGGSRPDEGRSVVQTADGGYLISGYTRSYGAGDADAWIIKTDPFGDTLWTQTVGTTGAEEAAQVIESADGGFAGIGFDFDPSAGNLNMLVFKSESIVSAIETPVSVQNFELFDNFPDPFNPSTIIKFDVLKNTELRLDVFDINGKHVERLAEGVFQAGTHTIKYSVQDLATGVYFYRLTSGSYSNTKRMVLMR